MLVDSHCHLDFPDFEDDMDAVLGRASAAGVGVMLSVCTHLSRFERVLDVAMAHDNIFCTVGVHPHEAANEEDISTRRLVELSDHPKVVGFGESGLDYHYRNSPREAQKASFLAHIQAARESGLPLVVHSREADADMAEILTSEYQKAPFSGLLHCFGSGTALAEAALAIGFYISFSGIVTFKNAENVREVAKTVPLQRILVETDAPYLAPAPKRGKR
ncbi:MAG TPA: TatD family deoxyribonuclease, partial [Alphaproteobacteria bacterium]|nr:TatD family deoxyribonuclease [Alphaproteobacteria bacterium]